MTMIASVRAAYSDCSGRMLAGSCASASAYSTAAAAEKFLNYKGIIPRGLGGYTQPNHLRIPVGTEEELRACIAALRAFLS